ncbi:MAG: phenylacetate--CoA ligase [Verrucomicrobia bacterium]|nr:phenylacetate--CoA ligase [Verrucomicrobiota bacterium]
MSTFDRRYETMPRPELEQVQLERLQALLVRLKRNVRRSREKIGDLRVESLADLARLPFTTPEDMVESFPYGMFAFPLREVIRLHSGVGPEGQPLVLGHTRNDLAQWSRLVARQLVAVGVTASDVIQICLGSGTYPGASGYVRGAELIEASVIAEDPFHVDYELAMLRNYRPTVLITTPTNASELVRLMEQRRIEPQSLHLRTVLLSRPVDQEARALLGAGLFAAVRCNLGVAEVLDPGLCLECEAGRFHVHEDHFLTEVVDGELIITTLCREAMPLLRFRTRLACEISRHTCDCGRTGAILKPGPRLDRRLCINETPVYETQIAAVLAQTGVGGRPFQLHISDRQVVITVEMSPEIFSDTIWYIERLQHEVESEFMARLGIEAKVHFVNPPHE